MSCTLQGKVKSTAMFCKGRVTCNTGQYDAFMAVAEKLLSKMTHDLLKLSLSTRTYSPTIEMYNQVWKLLKWSNNGILLCMI